MRIRPRYSICREREKRAFQVRTTEARSPCSSFILRTLLFPFLTSLIPMRAPPPLISNQETNFRDDYLCVLQGYMNLMFVGSRGPDYLLFVLSFLDTPPLLVEG
jgi:hypothetical protein